MWHVECHDDAVLEETSLGLMENARNFSVLSSWVIRLTRYIRREERPDLLLNLYYVRLAVLGRHEDKHHVEIIIFYPQVAHA